jgi:DNA-directed RNA polymerase
MWSDKGTVKVGAIMLKLLLETAKVVNKEGEETAAFVHSKIRLDKTKWGPLSAERAMAALSESARAPAPARRVLGCITLHPDIRAMAAPEANRFLSAESRVGRTREPFASRRAAHPAAHPAAQPMLVHPLPWYHARSGGYLTVRRPVSARPSALGSSR